MKYSKEFKVGILAVISITILYMGFNFLKGRDFLSGAFNYYLVFDRIEGLQPSNSVMLNGMSVGRVDAIEIMQDADNKVLVTIDVRKDLALPKTTQGILSVNLLGDRTIVLNMGDGPENHRPGDTLESVIEKGITDLIKEKSIPVLENLDTTIININRLAEQYVKAGDGITKVIENMQGATATLNRTLAQNEKRISEIAISVNDLLNSLEETEKSLKPILARMKVVADSINEKDLAEAIRNAEAASRNLSEVMAKINEGNGTMGKLVNNDSLYNNLNALTADLDKLIVDLNKNPKRYVQFSVFGRKDKAPKEK